MRFPLDEFSPTTNTFSRLVSAGRDGAAGRNARLSVFTTSQGEERNEKAIHCIRYDRFGPRLADGRRG